MEITDRRRADERLPRCCPNHSSWAQLFDHLVRDYAGDVSEAAVRRQVEEAREAAATVGLTDDPVEMLAAAELVARHNLELLVGKRREAARLDPEVHQRRPGGAAQLPRQAPDESVPGR